MQSAQQALVGALRREDMAAKQVQHLQLQLTALQDLLTANQKELQRNQMVMKFRNAEVERRRVCLFAFVSSAPDCAPLAYESCQLAISSCPKWCY